MWQTFLFSLSQKEWYISIFSTIKLFKMSMLPLVRWFIATPTSMACLRPQVSKAFLSFLPHINWEKYIKMSFFLELTKKEWVSHSLGKREYHVSWYITNCGPWMSHLFCKKHFEFPSRIPLMIFTLPYKKFLPRLKERIMPRFDCSSLLIVCVNFIKVRHFFIWVGHNILKKI